MRIFSGIWLAVILLLFSSRAGIAQTQDTHIKVKSMYVYQFASLVDWPAEFKKGDFVIGVFGKTPLYDELVLKYANKMMGSQAIKIKNFTSASEVTACHILIITPENSDKVTEMVKKFKSKSTLVVTEKEGKLKEGAIINFVIHNNKQSFELSKTNANKLKLVIGTKIEGYASKIE